MNVSKHNLARLAVYVGLVVATLAVYWQVRGFEFVDYDDGMYVTANPHVQSRLTWDSVKWAFTAHDGYWYPLTWLSHMLDWQLFGAYSGGHHLDSVLIHTIVTLLLFGWLAHATGAIGRSAFVAALFALHPLHVESVAWVAERKDVLYGLFWMLTLWAYVRYVERPDRVRYLILLASYAAGLMAKPMVVTLPLVLVLLDIWPLGRLNVQRSGDIFGWRAAGLWREKIPLFALAGASCIATWWTQYQLGAVVSVQKVGIGLRLTNALISYCRYLGKAIWPANLSVLYPYAREWPLSQTTLAVIALLVVSILAVRQLRSRPYLAVGWFWYLGTLVPVIGIVQVGSTGLADRYTYIPLCGVFISVAWLGHDLARGSRTARFTLSAVGVAIVVACAAVTWQQLHYWRNSVALFERALAVTEDNYMPHYHLGLVLAKQGKLDEAVAQFRQAERLEPDYAPIHYNLGLALALQSKYPEAIAEYSLAVRADSALLVARQGMFQARVAEGIRLAQRGEYAEAGAQFSEALRIDPRSANAHYDLGAALARQGKLGDAISHFEEAVRLDPNLAIARQALDDARGRMARPAVGP
jgi:Tfp pilus assembly protein PilF